MLPLARPQRQAAGIGVAGIGVVGVGVGVECCGVVSGFRIGIGGRTLASSLNDTTGRLLLFPYDRVACSTVAPKHVGTISEGRSLRRALFLLPARPGVTARGIKELSVNAMIRVFLLKGGTPCTDFSFAAA